MKNQSLRTKKLAKKRKLTKDYERRHNINKHLPSVDKEFKKEILAPATDSNGNIKTDSKGNQIMRRVGFKVITKRVKKKIGKGKDSLGYLIAYPASKKNKLSKIEIVRQKKADSNFIKTASGR